MSLRPILASLAVVMVLVTIDAPVALAELRGPDLCIRLQERDLFGRDRVIVDNDPAYDIQDQVDDVLQIDTTFGQYHVAGTLSLDRSSGAALTFTDVTITRIRAGTDDLLISLRSGHFTPFGAFLSTRVSIDGTGFGSGGFEVGASAQYWGRGQYSQLAFARKVGTVDPWDFSAQTAGEIITGPFNYLIGFLTINVEDVGSSLFLPGSFDFEISADGDDDPDGPASPELPGGIRQWSPLVGGNGHYYAVVQSPYGRPGWNAARRAAEGMRLFGRPGHLATVTSAAENDFIVELVQDDEVRNSAVDSSAVWLGGFQRATGEGAGAGAPPAPDEGWEWVTDEPWEYENWNEEEPNDWQGLDEGFLGLWTFEGPLGRWNDEVDDSPNPGGRFVVEWNIEIELPPSGFIRGDADSDGSVTISDAVRILDWLFREGEAPGCLDAADANDDGQIDLSDVIAILIELFLGRDTIRPPTGECGEDPTEDRLDCERASATCETEVEGRVVEEPSPGATPGPVNLERMECRDGRLEDVRFTIHFSPDDTIEWVEVDAEDTGLFCGDTDCTRLAAPEHWLHQFVGFDETYPRLLGDVDGDGLDDVVGFVPGSVQISRSTGSGFRPAEIWLVQEFVPETGWSIDRHVRVLGDVNGDGRDDIIGIRDLEETGDTVLVSLSTGSGFAPPMIWLTGNFGPNFGWRVGDHPRLARDVNGDGRDDLVAFGDDAVIVSLSSGSRFLQPRAVLPEFGFSSRAGGWGRDHPRVVGDVNGDGRDDIVGFAEGAVMVSLSTGSGFGPTRNALVGYFGYAQGWRIAFHPRLLGDMNGDGRADVVGIADEEVQVAYSNGAGFEAPIVVLNGFGYLHGWRVGRDPRMAGDVTGDGVADLVGSGQDGVHVSTCDVVR